MTDIIKKIISERSPVFFISPHFDDAVLSAGSMLSILSQKTSVTVINVFTQCGQINTLSAKAYLHQLGYISPKTLYQDREIEDKKSLSSAGINVINLRYTEALWRQLKNPAPVFRALGILLPEFVHIYPTYKFHVSSGKISHHDRSLLLKITADLKKILPNNAYVFCPYGLGNHVDHLLVREATQAACHPFLMADQPYTARDPSIINKLELDNTTVYKLPQKKLLKTRLVNGYTSQISGLFGSGSIPILEEYLIVPQSHPLSLGLPESLAGYTMVREVNISKHNNYIMGIYRGSVGQLAFVKMLKKSSISLAVYWLKNEICTYQLLNNIINSDLHIKRKFPEIHIPRLISWSVTGPIKYIMTEYVQGSNIGELNFKMGSDVLKKAHEFFTYLNQAHTSVILKSALIRRTLFYWILLLPIFTICSAIKHPGHLVLISKSIWRFIRNLRFLLPNREIGFVHRDLGYSNILIDGNQINILDFQLSCISHPILEYSIALLKIYSVTLLSEEYQKTPLFKSILKNTESRNIFISLSIIVCLNDLSIFDGEKPQNTINYLKYILTL